MEEKKNVHSIVKMFGSITDSFAKMKFVVLACIIGMVVTAIACVGYTNYTTANLANKIYVLDKGQVLTASRQDVSINRADEVRAQSERFHAFFFTVSPNREIVEQNIESALKLSADKSVYNYYNDLQEDGFYRRVAQSNAIQEVVVDSVQVDMKTYPYRVATYATLFLTRPSVVTKYSLITTMSMLDVPRDEFNLNGLKVENFNVVRREEVDRRRRATGNN